MYSRRESDRMVTILGIDNPSVEAIYRGGQGLPPYIILTRGSGRDREKTKQQIRQLEASVPELEIDLSMRPGDIVVFPVGRMTPDIFGECIYSRN